MAGAQISTGITIIDSLHGFQAVSLTEYATSAAAAIAAGSVVEIAGAFFTFSGDEAIEASTWTSIVTGNTAYIALTAAGTAGSQTVTAQYTSTAPTWRDDFQGWYASAASSVRVIGSVYKAEATNYARKYLIDATQQDYSRNYRWRGEVERITTGASTWAVPAGVFKIRVTCVGGGGGGGEGDNAGSDGASGASTLFTGATTGLPGSGGKGGSGTYGGAGGAGPTGGAGCYGSPGTLNGLGGLGGGAGGAGTTGVGTVGGYGGGGGGGVGGVGAGSGGGGGGTNISLVMASVINTLPGALISYTVGAGGTGGTGGGGSAGGTGGSGIIIIEY